VVHRLSLYEILSAPSGESKSSSTLGQRWFLHERQGRTTPTGLASNKSKGQKAVRMAHWCDGLGLAGVCNLHARYAHFGPRTHQLSKAEIAGTIIFSLLVWIVGGYLFGLSMWKTLDKKYR
jgi:hypothetical protein